jgi:hypothetical protein
MELLRTWLLPVAGAALLVAAADSLCPQGPVKGTVRLVGGLVLLTVVLGPLAGGITLDGTDLLADYRAQAAETTAQAEQAYERQMETLIAEETAAYIVDKAAQLGAACQAEVWCETGGDGVPLPAGVVVTGALTAEQWEELTRSLAEELGLDREDLRYEGGETG